MTNEDEFNTLNEEAGEWSMEDAIEFSFMEAREQAEAEAEKQKLEWARNVIEKFHQERSNKNDQ